VSLGYTRVVTHDSAQFERGEFSPGDVFLHQGDATCPGWIFAGRSDQLIKIYGRWVDTIALEHWLFDKMQDQIRELCIVPHDADGGIFELHLFATSRNGQKDELATLVKSVCEELPAFKRPAVTHVLDELPRTETGKIRRGMLKTMTLEAN